MQCNAMLCREDVLSSILVCVEQDIIRLRVSTRSTYVHHLPPLSLGHPLSYGPGGPLAYGSNGGCGPALVIGVTLGPVVCGGCAEGFSIRRGGKLVRRGSYAALCTGGNVEAGGSEYGTLANSPELPVLRLLGALSCGISC